MGRSGVSVEIPMHITRLTAQGVSADLIEAGLSPRLTAIAQTIERFFDNTAEAERSGKFSRMGMDELRAKLASEAHQQLGLIKADVEKYRVRIRDLSSRALASRSKKEDAASTLRAWEIRTLLREKDPVERAQLYKDAVRAGDLEFLDAVESAPQLFPVVSRALIEEHHNERLKAENPEGFKEIDDLEKVAAAIQTTLNSALQEMNKAGHPAPQPFEQALSKPEAKAA